MPKRIPFHVVYATSEDSSYPACELNAQGPAARGWRSAGAPPHELLLRLACVTNIHKLQLLAHHQLIPASVEVFVSGGLVSEGAATPCGATYTSVGKVSLAKPTPQARTRELRSAALPEPTTARFVKLKLSGPHPPAAEDDQVAVGSTYYVYSPGYPSNYPAGVQCRWIAFCPPGYNCRADCNDVDLPASSSCSLDRLLISKTGDPQLTSADYHCGRGSVTAVSTGQRLSIGLITSRSSPGGRFMCTLTAQRNNTASQCSCGYKKRNRIVGGQETRPNEYPMMAGLVYVSQRHIRCGSVIIDRRYVLTAAHCVVNKAVNDLAVIVGEHNVSTGGDSPATQGFRVSSYIVHPQFNPSTFDYDIAIVNLVGLINFSEYVGPVCLPFKFANRDFAGSKVTLLGWGTQAIGGETSDVLRKVDVDVISQKSCQSAVPTLTPRQMCTYTPGKDACQDDSGGPALFTDPVTGLLFNLGITSFGKLCAAADNPGVLTRVTALLDWIVMNAPADYCRK